jgi:hypothetical protein
LLTLACAGDLLCYCNDVLDLDIDGISNAMSEALWLVRRMRMCSRFWLVFTARLRRT